MAMSTRIKLEFQSSGYSKDEIDEYRRLFEDLGEVQAETYEQPAAGAAFGLAILIFVGLAIAEGAIYDLAKKLGTRLLNLWRRRKERGKHPPEASEIQFHFTDIVVTLGNDDRGRYSPDEFSLHTRVLENLPEIMEQVRTHLSSPPLNARKFKFLRVPVLAAQEKANEALIKQNWKLSDDPRGPRYGFGTYYDSAAKAVFDVKEPTA